MCTRGRRRGRAAPRPVPYDVQLGVGVLPQPCTSEHLLEPGLDRRDPGPGGGPEDHRVLRHRERGLETLLARADHHDRSGGEQPAGDGGAPAREDREQAQGGFRVPRREHRHRLPPVDVERHLAEHELGVGGGGARWMLELAVGPAERQALRQDGYALGDSARLGFGRVEVVECRSVPRHADSADLVGHVVLQGGDRRRDARSIPEPRRPVAEKISRGSPVAGGGARGGVEDSSHGRLSREAALDSPSLRQPGGTRGEREDVRDALGLDGVGLGLDENSRVQVVDEQQLKSPLCQRRAQLDDRRVEELEHGRIALEHHRRPGPAVEQPSHAPERGHLRSLDVHLDDVDVVPADELEQLVDARHWHLDGLLRGLIGGVNVPVDAPHDERDHAGTLGARDVLIGDGRVDHPEAVEAVAVRRPAQQLDVGGRGVHCQHVGTEGGRGQGERAQVAPEVEHTGAAADQLEEGSLHRLIDPVVVGEPGGDRVAGGAIDADVDGRCACDRNRHEGQTAAGHHPLRHGLDLRRWHRSEGPRS